MAGRCRSVAVLLVTAAVTAAGCTPDPAPPPPPAPSPKPSPTRTETQLERQMRLDFEAAEKSYRTFRTEINRVLRAGGASRATPIMKATAESDYLVTFTEVARLYKRKKERQIGDERIGYVRRNAHSFTSLLLDVCEDYRQVSIEDSEGNREKLNEVKAYRLEVNKAGGRWKVSNGTGRVVKSCTA